MAGVEDVLHLGPEAGWDDHPLLVHHEWGVDSEEGPCWFGQSGQWWTVFGKPVSASESRPEIL